MTYSLLKPPRIAARLVHVHPDASELNRVYQADLPIRRLALGCGRPPRGDPAGRIATMAGLDERRAARIREVRRDTGKGRAKGVDMAVVIRTWRHSCRTMRSVANGAGNFTVWVHRFFTYKAPHTELAPTSGAMGYGFPAAIAAALRYPDRLTVCVAGDGDFPDVSAGTGHRGAIRRASARAHRQQRHVRHDSNAPGAALSGRVSATELSSPDFVVLAASFGAYAERVETTEAFAPALRARVPRRRSSVLELRVDPNQITPDRRID
jgi:acetolactate synthase-1/2/3 large subunit